MDEQVKEIEELKQKLAKSEARYDVLMEHATDGIYLVDLDDNFIEVNSGLCRMLGYSQAELLQMKVHQIIDPEHLKTDPIYRSGLREKKLIVRERIFAHKSGEQVHVELNIKLFEDNKALVIARDITGRKKMEGELRIAELKFRTIAEHSMVGIYIYQDDKLVYVNPRFADILGYEVDELTGKLSIEDLFHQDYTQLAREKVRARLAGEVQSVQYEAKFKQKSGKSKWVGIYGSMMDFGGKPSIIGSLIDITERKRTEEVLMRSEANLQTILNTTDTAYALFDSDLHVLALNQMAATFVEHEYHHLLKKGDYMLDIFSADRYPHLHIQTAEVLNGKNLSYELRYPQENGTSSWFYVRMFPIRNDGEIFGLMMALYNITDRKNAEYKLQAAYNQIQNQVNHIREIAWKQSHLLRSPVANLKGLLGMLKNDPDDIITLNYVETEIGRLDDIIIDMVANSLPDQSS